MSYTTDQASGAVNILTDAAQLTGDPFLIAQANYLKAQTDYQIALDAYNASDWWKRTWETGPALKKAKTALNEAETVYQNFASGKTAGEIQTENKSSILDYWPVFAALIVAGVVLFIIIKKRK